MARNTVTPRNVTNPLGGGVTLGGTPLGSLPPSVTPVTPPSGDTPGVTTPGWSGVVKLSIEDLGRAEECADEMIRKSRNMADRFGEESRESHRIGALGEIAFARFMNVPWKCHPGDIGGKPDVAGYEVRAVPSTAQYLSLKVKDNDKDHTRCVLVALLHHDTAALVVGWLTAADGRRLGKRLDPNRREAPAWFVNDLRLLHNVERLTEAE